MALFIPKKYEVLHTYQVNIKKVWDFIKDYTAWNYLIKDIVSTNKFHKGDNTYTPGNEYSHTWYGVGELLHKCVVIEETPNDKFGSWEIYAEVLGITYHQNFYLLKDTNQDRIIFKWEIVNGEFDNVAFTIEIIEGYKQTIKAIMVLMEKHLTTKVDKYKQMESIIIKSSQDKVWSVITNWPLLRTVAPIVADKVEVSKDQLEVGVKINLGFKKKKVMHVCCLEVIDVDKNNFSKWNYKMTCHDTNLQVPRQEVEFVCIKIVDDLTFLSFKHKFMECIDTKFIDNLTKNKREILERVKLYLEV